MWKFRHAITSLEGCQCDPAGDLPGVSTQAKNAHRWPVPGVFRNRDFRKMRE